MTHTPEQIHESIIALGEVLQEVGKLPEPIRGIEIRGANREENRRMYEIIMRIYARGRELTKNVGDKASIPLVVCDECLTVYPQEFTKLPQFRKGCPVDSTANFTQFDITYVRRYA
jgi:hypothetical protein